MADTYKHSPKPLRGVQFTLASLQEMGFSTPTGYSFKRWCVEKHDQEEIITFDDGQQVTLTEDTNLYAEWEPIQYSIEYVLNGYGQAQLEWRNSYTVLDEYSPDPPINTNPRFVFAGWDPPGIEKGTINQVIFTAQWQEVSVGDRAISYINTLGNNEAVQPTSSTHLFTYNPMTLEKNGYSPPDLADAQNNIDLTGYTGTAIQHQVPRSQIQKYNFMGWLPSKLHYGRTTNMEFYGRWHREYFSYRGPKTSKPVGVDICDKALLVQVVDGEWVLTFGSNQTIQIYHHEETSHWIRLFIRIYIEQNKKTYLLCNIPIPASCVSGQPSTIPLLTEVKEGGQQIQLTERTISYTLGNHETKSIKIQDIPIRIPVPGSNIPNGVLVEDGKKWPVPTGFDPNGAWSYQVWFCQYHDDPEHCDGFDITLFRDEDDEKKEYARLYQKHDIPQYISVYYDDTSSSKTAIKDDFLTEINGTTLSSYINQSGKNVKSVVVGNRITKIKTAANANWENAKEVILAPGVKTLEAEAFQNSKLVNMVVPETVTSIGSGVFNGCSQLKMLAFECLYSTLANVNGLLTGCGSVETLHLNCTKAQYQAKANDWWNGTMPNTNIKIICTDYAFDKDGNNLNID